MTNSNGLPRIVPSRFRPWQRVPMSIRSVGQLAIVSLCLLCASPATAQESTDCYELEFDETCVDDEQVEWFRNEVALRAPSVCEPQGWHVNWVVREDLCELVVSPVNTRETDDAISVPVPAFPSRDEVRDAAVRATLVMGWVAEEPDDADPPDDTVPDADPDTDPPMDDADVGEETSVESDEASPEEPETPADDEWHGGSLVDGLYQSGGWLALHFSGSRFNGDTTLMAGLRGGVTFNHSFTVGLSASIDALGMQAPASLSQDRKTFMGVAYGGLLAQIDFLTASTVHFGVELVIGVGAAYWATDDDDDGQIQGREMDRMRTAPLGIITPGIHGAVRILPWLRFVAGASYRWVPYVDQVELRDEDLEGITIDLSLAFGEL